MYTIREINNVKKPTYQINKLPDRYIEALLKKTESTMEENKKVVNKINLKSDLHLVKLSSPTTDN